MYLDSSNNDPFSTSSNARVKQRSPDIGKHTRFLPLLGSHIHPIPIPIERESVCESDREQYKSYNIKRDRFNHASSIDLRNIHPATEFAIPIGPLPPEWRRGGGGTEDQKPNTSSSSSAAALSSFSSLLQFFSAVIRIRRLSCQKFNHRKALRRKCTWTYIKCTLHSRSNSKKKKMEKKKQWDSLSGVWVICGGGGGGGTQIYRVGTTTTTSSCCLLA